MHISAEGLQIIKGSETFRSRLYNCPAGHCTIAWGHLVHKGPCCGLPSELPFKDGIDEEQGDALLKFDVEDAENDVKRLVKVPIDQSEFDALVDFVYNLGVVQFQESTLLRKLNAGDYDGAAEEFGKWVYSNHKKLSGLAKRRAEEKALFVRDLPRIPVKE